MLKKVISVGTETKPFWTDVTTRLSNKQLSVLGIFGSTPKVHLVTDAFENESDWDRFAIDPIHLKNVLYYCNLGEGVFGFQTPSSECPDLLGAVFACRCIEQVKAWLSSNSKDGWVPAEPFVIAELGGGQGILQKYFLKYLDHFLNGLPEGRAIREKIYILPIDQSGSLLEVQKKKIRESGYCLVDSEPWDMGKVVTECPDWLSPYQKNIQFVFSCELMDDVSGAKIVCKEGCRWYECRMVVAVPQTDEFPANSSAILKTESGLPENYCVLTHQQAVNFFTDSLGRHNGKSPYMVSVLKRPCGAPHWPDRTTLGDGFYISNSFEGVSNFVNNFCSPHLGMIHIDYFSRRPVQTVGFFPLVEDRCPPSVASALTFISTGGLLDELPTEMQGRMQLKISQPTIMPYVEEVRRALGERCSDQQFLPQVIGTPRIEYWPFLKELSAKDQVEVRDQYNRWTRWFKGGHSFLITETR